MYCLRVEGSDVDMDLELELFSRGVEDLELVSESVLKSDNFSFFYEGCCTVSAFSYR